MVTSGLEFYPDWRRFAAPQTFVFLAVMIVSLCPNAFAVIMLPLEESEFHVGVGAFTLDDPVGEVQIEFVNSTEEELVFHKLTTDCGCTDAQIVPEVIAPGQPGAIIATVDATGKSGEFETIVRVEFNEGIVRSAFFLEGYKQGALIPSRVFFGKIGEDQEKAKRISLDIFDRSFRVSDDIVVNHDSSKVRVEYLHTAKLPVRNNAGLAKDGWQFYRMIYEVVLDGSSVGPNGLSAAIEFSPRDNTWPKVGTIAVAEATSLLTVKPSSLFFVVSRGADGRSRKQTLHIAGENGELEGRIVSDSPALAVSQTESTKAEIELDARDFQLEDLDKLRRGKVLSLVVTEKGKEIEKIGIPVHVVYR